MKTWRLVSGILSVIFAAIAVFPACVAGVAGGYLGIILFLSTFLLLAAGIVSICARDVKNKGGSLTMALLFGIASIAPLASTANTISFLTAYGVWCVACASTAIYSLVVTK